MVTALLPLLKVHLDAIIDNGVGFRLYIKSFVDFIQYVCCIVLSHDFYSLSLGVINPRSKIAQVSFGLPFWCQSEPELHYELGRLLYSLWQFFLALYEPLLLRFGKCQC